MEKGAFADRCAAVVGTAFPAGTDIKMTLNDDLIFAIDWPLNTDQNRPNKRSRIINLIIAYEAIEDCRDFNIAERNLKRFIQEKLIYFNPEHEHSKYMSQPVQEWVVTTSTLNLEVTKYKCYLCGEACEYEWIVRQNYLDPSLLSFYNCGNCGEFFIPMTVKTVILPVEKEKVAKFAYGRKTETSKPFVLYADDEELQEFSGKDHCDLFKWSEFISTLEADGSKRRRRIGF
jgi:DNA-directed RNA polymerase subunit M/transcription elongation factor TFIIS